jgi:hypothetical protein
MRDVTHNNDPPLPPDGMPICVSFTISIQIVLISIFLMWLIPLSQG